MNLPVSMHAVVIDRDNGFALKDVQVPLPAVGEQDVLVRVDAAAINPADQRLLARARENPAISILGFDACGTVVQTGAAVQHIAVGDAVYYAGDVSRAGCFAQYQAVHADLVGIKPARLSAAEAAAMPLTALTAWELLHERFCLERGRLLVLGGAGGVGSQLIQLAARLPDVEIIASASRPESRDWCLQLGAHRVIDHSRPLAAQLPEAVSHAVLAHHPDAYLKALPPLMQPFGHIACIVPLAAAADLNPLMQKSLSFHWEYMFTKPLFQPSDRPTQGHILNQISRWLDEGLLRSTQTRCLGPVCAQNAQHALALLASGQTIGKLTFANL